jgi:DNA-binding IclR family transcriptional regulator
MTTRQSSTLAKGLRLLHAIVCDGGHSTLTELARQEAIPLATAHRLAATLEEEGYVDRLTRGCFLPGRVLIDLQLARPDPTQRLASRLRRPLGRLARRHRVLLHFGILEDGMVTYLVKENGGEVDLFTAESMQLEAYCSAIGKVLLAALPSKQLDNYLRAGPFVALTPNTITNPDAIRGELEVVREAGLAFDRHEIREDLYCFAIPVSGPDGNVIGALSSSFMGSAPPAALFRQLHRSLRRLAADVAHEAPAQSSGFRADLG